jgi:proline iminopeptidase
VQARALHSREGSLSPMFPAIEPFASGHLQLPGSNAIHWETSGNPSGNPALYLQGGEAHGSAPRLRLVDGS